MVLVMGGVILDGGIDGMVGIWDGSDRDLRLMVKLKEREEGGGVGDSYGGRIERDGGGNGGRRWWWS